MQIRRRAARSIALFLFCALTCPGDAQPPPSDLTTVQPVPTSYVPAKAPWGDPDFRGTWPFGHADEAALTLERPKEDGKRAWLTQEEFAKRLDAAKKSDGKYSAELRGNGTKGLAQWIGATELGHRTSLLVDPPDGQLPPLTPEAERLHQAGRASWVRGQPIDWVDDLDNWDRCVSPGFSAAMMPFPFDTDGIRIWQAPGLVVIQHELLGARLIRLDSSRHWPASVRSWKGDSIGHWEGNTLVIETTNIVAGDSATHEMSRRAASPTYIPDPHPRPMSEQAKAVERLTMVGPNRIIYQLTYSDPKVYTAPWTVRLDWVRDENYQLYEFACHEANVQIRTMINASRAQREKDAVAAGKQ